MKILQVINSLATGGGEKIILESLPKLVEAGIDVELLLLNGNKYPFLVELEEKHCCKINTLGNGSVYNPFLIFKIIPYLKRFDIVHVHLFPALYWVALARLISFSRAKLLYTEHSTFNRRRRNNFYRLIDMFIYKQYIRIISVSTEVKLFLKKHIRTKNSKFITIYNGIDFDKIYNAVPADRTLLSKNNNDKIIIQVARFTEQKDQETLLKSIPFLNHKVLILFVGDGPGIEKMKELASTLEIEDKVTFLGLRSDVPQLLKMADIAVMSSHHEGLSLSGIEAMASGTPLIASKVSGLSTLVHNAGILFVHQDPVDLANNINQLLSNKKLYDKTVASCLKRAMQYSIDKMISDHIQLYSEVCQSPS